MSSGPVRCRCLRWAAGWTRISLTSWPPRPPGGTRRCWPAVTALGGASVPDLHYDLERDAVRVVLADAGGRILLVHAMTPDRAPGGWWGLPCGGVRPGRSYPGATG